MTSGGNRSELTGADRIGADVEEVGLETRADGLAESPIAQTWGANVAHAGAAERVGARSGETPGVEGALVVQQREVGGDAGSPTSSEQLAGDSRVGP
jgi:hypothetical protein